MAEVKQNLLINLDSLLDTRLGVIYQRFPKRFRKLSLEAYTNRPHNRIWDIIGCTKEVWMSQWGLRDLGALESSRPTNLLLDLKNIIVSRYIQGKTSPVHCPLELTINIWPYQLDKSVAQGVIDAVRQWTFDDMLIKTVYISPTDLTPEHIKSHYQSLFLEDWVEWMTIHTNALKVTKLPVVVFNIPRYLHDEREELVEAAFKNDVDPFAQLKRYLSDTMSLEWLDTRLFTLPSPDLS